LKIDIVTQYSDPSRVLVAADIDTREVFKFELLFLWDMRGLQLPEAVMLKKS
jgi:hypothetical protein